MTSSIANSMLSQFWRHAQRHYQTIQQKTHKFSTEHPWVCRVSIATVITISYRFFPCATFFLLGGYSGHYFLQKQCTKSSKLSSQSIPPTASVHDSPVIHSPSLQQDAFEGAKSARAYIFSSEFTKLSLDTRIAKLSAKIQELNSANPQGANSLGLSAAQSVYQACLNQLLSRKHDQDRDHNKPPSGCL